MEEFLKYWDYIGVFVGIIITGLGAPMPEELPVVLGGAIVQEWNPSNFRWWRMLLACIAGVIVGDSCLYCIGRFWGTWLVRRPFIKKHLLPPERLVSISHNFDKYGVKILLFARLTPGIRAPIFITAGITKLPWFKFLLADGIYAVPGVSLLFLLGYWFGDSVAGIIAAGESQVRSIVWMALLVIIVCYFVYRHLRKPVVEGSPKEMPPVVGQVTNVLDQSLHTVKGKLDQSLHTVKDKLLHPHGDHGAGHGDAAASSPPSASPTPPPPSNGQLQSPADVVQQPKSGEPSH